MGRDGGTCLLSQLFGRLRQEDPFSLVFLGQLGSIARPGLLIKMIFMSQLGNFYSQKIGNCAPGYFEKHLI
jgi:hypothetical protein